jgi:hypothetical protein
MKSKKFLLILKFGILETLFISLLKSWDVTITSLISALYKDIDEQLRVG